MNERPRSNSFHYTLDGVVGALAHPRYELCPARPVASVWPRGRAIFLRHQGRVARFVSGSRDFTDAELSRVAHETGQLYLDVSRKDSLDDFARDLVALRRSPVCDGCPSREACPGLFEAVAGDAFTRDDARVRSLLQELEGDVLDVGCGEGPYEDILAPAARAGRIRYVGLEPDPARVAHLRARWPWAELYVGTAEDAPPLPRPPRHVLLLRSWNHLRNPVQVIETFVGPLPPGGTLLLVDNVAFGVVRGRALARQAERGPAVFEHHRNDGSAEAHALVERVAPGLRLLERHDVAPGTSNQWLLRYGAR